MTHTIVLGQHAPQTQETGDRALPVLPHADDLARYGGRLRAALKDVLEALPNDIHNPAKLHEALGTDRSTCYRLWRASRVSPNRWDDLALALPGSAAMHGFAEALKRRRLALGVLDAYESAVDQFDAFVREKFSSQTRLKNLLETAQTSPSEMADPLRKQASTAKAAAFENAVTLNQSSVDLDGAIVLVTPSQRPGCAAEVAMVLAYMGYRASPGGRPLMIHLGSQREDPDGGTSEGELEILDSVGEPIRGRSGHCVVPEFSSHPLPSVIRERSDSSAMTGLCVDPSDIPQLRTGFDVVVALQLDPIPQEPGTGRVPFKGFVKAIDHPTRSLIVDVYLHRSLAAACIPEASCHALGPSWLRQGERASWASRLPEHPELRILPKDLNAADQGAWPRYAEMCRYLFEWCGVNRGDYAGHRMSSVFPIWSTSYKLAFYEE